MSKQCEFDIRDYAASGDGRTANTGAIPDFHVVWGSGLRGGYLRTPLAQPPRDSIEPYALQDCDIQIQ